MIFSVRGMEKLTVYAYAFMLLGLAQSVYELKTNSKKLNFLEFLKLILKGNDEK
jgi:hypothetical protein